MKGFEISNRELGSFQWNTQWGLVDFPGSSDSILCLLLSLIRQFYNFVNCRNLIAMQIILEHRYTNTFFSGRNTISLYSVEMTPNITFYCSLYINQFQIY